MFCNFGTPGAILGFILEGQATCADTNATYRSVQCNSDAFMTIKGKPRRKGQNVLTTNMFVALRWGKLFFFLLISICHLCYACVNRLHENL